MYGLLAILEAKLILEDLEAKKEGYDSETEREETKNVATKEKVEEESAAKPPTSSSTPVNLQCSTRVSILLTPSTATDNLQCSTGVSIVVTTSIGEW